MFRLVCLLLELATRLLRELGRLPRRAAQALNPGNDASSRRLLWAIALASSAGLAASWAMPRVTLVMSPSIEAWAVRSAPGPIRKGDLVQFTLSHPVAGPKPVSVTKYALCMPGEQVRVALRPPDQAKHVTAAFFCSDASLGTSLAMGRGGMKLSPANIGGVIPPDFVYVGSHHPHGFDSRYFGLVRIERLRRMERLF
ncbi:peptidase [Sphingomonas sp. MG17]|uniref:Peptidase n=1 Tax=Sphingomonas tagetis TaxID=2949092 RepID=A0A9X2KMY1_9SPHN|nr:peptidase [Sphingomonas tagetis]MCP3732192.1 peptidase [Sphingomonas tagetis]